MKAIVNKDRRSEADKKFDSMWNKMVREAKLNRIQENTVAAYLRELLGIRMREVTSAVDMSWIISLVEKEKFGTNVSRGATRLLRAQAYAADLRNEAYGKGCVNANGVWDKYDGCGLERLQSKLAGYDIEYDANL